MKNPILRRLCAAVCLVLLVSAVSCEIADGADTEDSQSSEPVTTVLSETPSGEQTTAVPAPDTEQTTGVPVEPGEVIVAPDDKGYTYPMLVEDLAALEATYGDKFFYESIGKSVDGREIYACIVGNPGAPRKIMITGGIHGREYLSSLLVMMQIEHYLSRYTVGKYNGLAYYDMFEEFAFYILPMINPDGVMLALEGIDSVQTPEVRETLEAIYADNLRDGLTGAEDINDYFAYNWKSNANGVDLNRNFALSNWRDVTTGIMSPCFRNYKGPSAASEPETKAVSAWVQSLGEIEGMLAFHTAGQVVYWDCGMSGAVRQETSDLARAVCDHTGYKFIYDKHLDASLNDWMTLELDVPTVTVELAEVVYPMPPSQIDQAWEQARELWVITAQFFG